MRTRITSSKRIGGVPKERWGMSNNPHTHAKTPSFAMARFLSPRKPGTPCAVAATESFVVRPPARAMIPEVESSWARNYLCTTRLTMRKQPAVEDAKAIMTEGMQWGVWKWLMEKKRVRGIADEARTALDDAEDKVKATWSDDLKIAYNQLVSQDGDAKQARRKAKPGKKEEAPKTDSQVMAAVKRVKEADDEAYNAHEDA